MPVSCRWSRRALADIQDIHSWVRRDDLTSADRLVAEFFDAIERMSMPTAAPMVASREERDLREIYVYRYRIIFRVSSDEAINVVAVRHGARPLAPADPLTGR
ncbi:MAG: type II toxin-antitoxin system RelE/ParE family toxin [Planctomycetota bacterium]